MKKAFLFLLMLTSGLVSCQNSSTNTQTNPVMKEDKVIKTETEWKKILSDEEYYILRQKGTEAPFSGKYYLTSDKGTYSCAACGYELFTSDMKFESHCGWPSFDKEIGAGDRIKKIKDLSHGMIRTEIVCARCDGHLGHIFDDGPTETGNRYCVNSISIKFAPADTTKK